jgi:uncharacterized phage-associated protein
MPFFDFDVTEPEFDRETFEEVVLYICSQVENIRNLSMTKLHKILYYVDREVYLQTGSPLTGETYIANQYGPTSEHLPEALEALDAEGKLSHVTRKDSSDQIGTYEQNIFIAKETPDVDEAFQASEIQLLDDIIEQISVEFTAEQISDLSHDIVWRSARKGEELPYYTTMLQVTESEESAEDHEWAREKAQEVR